MVSQPRPVSARRVPSSENSASSGISSQVTCTCVAAAASCNPAVAATARDSGRHDGSTTRSRGRASPAAYRVWLTAWSTWAYAAGRSRRGSAAAGGPPWYASQEIGCADLAEHMMQIVLDGLRSRA